MMLRCSSASMRTSSHCAAFVSWNSSTRTCWKRCWYRSQRVGVLAEQPHREHEQVVEVDGRRLGQPPLVLGVHLGDAALGRADRHLGVLRGQHQLVLQRADLRVQLPGREALRVEVQVAAHPVGEALRVGLVVDREARPVAEQRRLAPQDARARGVERRHPHAAADRPDQLRRPAPASRPRPCW